jgi:hypothetical protein
MGYMCSSLLYLPMLDPGAREAAEGGKSESRQVAAGLISGQVKQCSRRRKLVRVRQVMRLGTQAALQDTLQG